MAKAKQGDGDSKADVRAALERVLDHAESHGEVYDGATEDHAAIRELIAELDDGK